MPHTDVSFSLHITFSFPPAMAQSPFPNQQYTSEKYVESCGAIVHDIPRQKVCLIHLAQANIWTLPKGRRNVGESRQQAALREVYEETGYKCHILPVDMITRATIAGDAADAPDVARILHDSVEPFMVTTRTLKDDQGVKIIWWYIAIMNEGAWETKGPGEEGVESGLYSYEEAEGLLHFETDREVLRKAGAIVAKSG
jgi:ADP-ribose pyrophosphatase YjhB (NUDIX family)